MYRDGKRHPYTLSDTERMYNERTHVRANIKYVGVSTYTHTHTHTRSA